MSHGGLPAQRPDQVTDRSPRTVAPGQRVQQVANNKTGLPITVEVINSPTAPVITEDGGIPGALSAQAIAADSASAVLIPAGVNVNGLKLWAASMSSLAASPAAVGPPPVGVDDKIMDSGGVTYLGLENGISTAGQSATSTSLDLRGITVPAGRSVSLVNQTLGSLHRTAATLIYTVL